MYSTSPASDLLYFGNSFDSSDYIDFSKMDNKDQIPLITNGEMSLPVLTKKSWVPRSVIIDEGSNGYLGNNHAAYASPDAEAGYEYFFVKNPTSRSKENIRDNNPLTFFEYEQINIPAKNKTQGSNDYEYQYIVKSLPDTPVVYDDWSSFKGSSLMLNIVLERETAESANYILITPYFGSGSYISKDIIVNKIEVTNELNQVENIISQPIYISSGLIPNSLDRVKNFYYKEAKVSFAERKVKKIKIYFEQKDATEVKIKHVYYKPTTLNNPYSHQARFNPQDPKILPGLPYSSIGWQKDKIIYDKNQLIPSIDKPNFFKAEVQNTQKVDVKLYRNIPIRTGFCVKVKGTDGLFRRITTRFFDNFSSGSLNQSTYNDINDDNYTEFVSAAKVVSNGEYLDPYLSSYSTQDLNGTPTAGALSNSQELDQIVNWFNTTTAQGTKEQKYAKFNLDVNFPAVKEDTDSETKEEMKPANTDLIRQYEILDGQRRSIGLRDITVGYETYSDKATVITKQYDTTSDIEYMTISSESGFSGATVASISDYLKYYISLDDGAKWIQISSIENEFASVPEVIAFNQNIDENFRMPGVSYLSQPDVPASIKKFILKIEMTKPTGTNISPIVYSYKVGVKVKQ